MNFSKIFFSILFTIICITSAYYYFMYYKKKNKVLDYYENNELVEIMKNSNSEFYLFYTDWCPHCKEALPIFDNLKNNTEFADFNINYIKIDCDDKTNKNLVKKFNIKEYPSYILSMNEKTYIFDANLSNESFRKFINAVLNKK